MTLPAGNGDASDGAVDLLLRFGCAMLHAGATATRTRELLETLAGKLSVNIVSIGLTPENIAVCTRGSNGSATVMHDVGPLSVNAWRVAELEKLASTAASPASPGQIAQRIAEIEAAPPLHSGALVAAAVGVASGAFAFLNGAALPDMVSAAVGGAAGQFIRSSLSRRLSNPVGVTAISGITALTVFVLASALQHRLGLSPTNYQAGFISTVLFLIPGVPLIAGLFDLIQRQTLIALSRMAHAGLLLMTIASCLSVVVAIADADLVRVPSPELTYWLQIVLRAVASFVAGCAFAMLFNGSMRAVLAAGALALAANSVRLILIDMGTALAPAAFVAAFLVGIIALLLSRRLLGNLMAICAAPIVIMIPGLYAFELIVLLNRGQINEALQAFASCGFVVSALAMGLTAARLAVRRQP